MSLFGSEGMDEPLQQQQQNGASGGRQEAATPRAQPQQQQPQDMPNTAALLDQVFESICRPLKVPPGCRLRSQATGQGTIGTSWLAPILWSLSHMPESS